MGEDLDRDDLPPWRVPSMPRATSSPALAVIEAFDQDRPRLTISEVAERTGPTRAAARRYLLTLTHLGFVPRAALAITPLPGTARCRHPRG